LSEKKAAIDINPIQNPYVSKKEDGTVSIDPIEGTSFYQDRAQYIQDPAKADAAGVIVPGGGVYRAFSEVFGQQYAWTWGGHWKSALDYMHFSWNDMSHESIQNRISDRFPRESAQKS
jgi:D-alanyl-D-alanine carboxypeptidase